MERRPISRTLIERARRGDRAAQSELWQINRRWVAAIVLAHRPRAVEVDDLMQEIAVKVIAKLHTLRDPDALKPWLRQIVINVCRGAARGLRPTARLATSDVPGREDGEVAMPAGRGPSADEIVSRRDEADRLFHQALTLPSEYREPLLLRCVRSLSYQQISEILDLPVTTIETRLARARRMLRQELQAGGGGAE